MRDNARTIEQKTYLIGISMHLNAMRRRLLRLRQPCGCCPSLRPTPAVRTRNKYRSICVDGPEVRAMSLFGRKSRPARRRTNQPAWMTADGGFAARQCTVIDISEGGARLRVEDPQFVKPQFQLKFDRTSPGRACKVAWKKGDVIGIKFV
jgi:hypothetical protein